MLKLSALTIGLLLTAHAGGQSGQTATGVVFEDTNADGKRQSHEKGIPDVAVTNGTDVVRTDSAGRYALGVTDDTSITVIKPAGYQVPLNEHNLPQHTYTHMPSGSPDDGFLFKGVEPTGDLPASVDFALTPVHEPEKFTVIVFGDPQPYSLKDVDYFRSEVIDTQMVLGASGPEANIHGALFGISLGDLVGDNLDLFYPLNEAQSLLGVPWYNVYGNHDMNFLSGDSSLTASDPDRYADDTYQRVYGSPNYAFQYGRAHFIVLDNVIYQGYDGMNDTTLPGWANGKRPVSNNYRGGLRTDQIEFVRNYLATVPVDDLVIVSFHIPIEGNDVHRIPEQRELFEALSTHPHTFSMSGHTHIQRHWFFGEEHGYTADAINQHNTHNPERFDGPVHHHLNVVTASGSWYRGAPDEYNRPHTQMADGAPNGYTLLHIDGNEYSTEFRAAHRETDHQMSVHIDGRGVTLNVFNGAEGDRVRMRVDSGHAADTKANWIPMDYSVMKDPHLVAVHGRETSIPNDIRGYRTVSEPKESYHIWTKILPDGLRPGTHVLEFEHQDIYGKTNRSVHTFRIN